MKFKINMLKSEEKPVAYIPQLIDVKTAAEVLKNIAVRTPLIKSGRFSNTFDSNILLKREDLQKVRSYKIRGAFNKVNSLNDRERKAGIICASAGNHAQGVAFSCQKLGIKGTIYMPLTTPKQKIDKVKMFGGHLVDIVLCGDTFDDANQAAMDECKRACKTFVHPFDDEKVIEGQATIALEILEETHRPIDYVLVAIGGGGLAAGLSSIFRILSPDTKIIGIEPEGAAAMKISLENKENTTLYKMDKFVDGAAVRRVGDKTFHICKHFLDEIYTVSEGKVCKEILDLYNADGIIVEPAGALTIAALDFLGKKIKGKTVVCVVSGGNNDITRTAEIEERALLYAHLKHYFMITFPQRAGALKQFVAEILGPNDDITHFQYVKKNARENAPAIVGIELKDQNDFEPLLQRMKNQHFYGDYLNDKPDLFQYLLK